MRDRQAPGAIGFAFRFALLLAAASAALVAARSGGDPGRRWNGILAVVTAAVARATGLEAHEIAGAVAGPGFALEIVDACNGLDAALVFVAGVLALPLPWRRRLGAVAAGVPLLLALNVMRLAGLYWIGLAHPAWIEAAHLYAGQALMILASLLLWMRLLTRTRAPGLAAVRGGP